MEFEVKRIINPRKSNNSEVKEVLLKSKNTKACAKIIKVTGEQKLNSIINEIINLKIVQDEPLALTYYNWFFKHIKKDTFELTILTELCDNGDLGEILKRRVKYNLKMKDQDIIKTIKDFTNFFYLLQTKSISHRDIKPENIFITATDQYKVGDFGSSILVSEEESYSIKGTPLYLSPELRDGYNNFCERIAPNSLAYSPYKSDVYSLGLVFLYMSTLEKIDHNFSNLSTLQSLLDSKLLLIENARIRTILSKMLTIDPELRPDFENLKNIVDQVTNPLACANCWSECDLNERCCENCGFWVHRKCSETNTCKNCNSKIVKQCSSCKNSLDSLRDCSHSECEMCCIWNLDCRGCILFDILSSDSKFNKNVCCPVYACCRCNAKIEFVDQEYYFCGDCDLKYCGACKSIYHPRIRCLDTDVFGVVCSCKNLCHREPDELFYECPECGYRCVVCMGRIEKTHSDCSYLLGTLYY